MLKRVKSQMQEEFKHPASAQAGGDYRLGTGPASDNPNANQFLAGAAIREPASQQSVRIWVQNGAATLVILSFVGLLFCVLYRENDLVNKDIFNILLGILGTVVVQIFQYWFGASATSPDCRHKDQRETHQG
jgi:hypothetical protein